MAEFNFDDIESDGKHVHTVLMKYGEQEREIPFDQINTTNIGLVFSLNPSTVWVQDGYGSRIFIPNESGIFQLPSSAALPYKSERCPACPGANARAWN